MEALPCGELHEDASLNGGSRINSSGTDCFNLGDQGQSERSSENRLDYGGNGQEEYRNVMDEYFFNGLYTGKPRTVSRDPICTTEITCDEAFRRTLAEESQKKRFRELAKKYHPDAGGDSRDFIMLMESIAKLWWIRSSRKSFQCAEVSFREQPYRPIRRRVRAVPNACPFFCIFLPVDDNIHGIVSHRIDLFESDSA